MTNKELRKLLKKHPNYTIKPSSLCAGCVGWENPTVMLRVGDDVLPNSSHHLLKLLKMWRKSAPVLFDSLDCTVEISKKDKTITFEIDRRGIL